MHNPYYHAFQIGWNNWYLVAPLLLLCAITISSIGDISIGYFDRKHPGLLRYRRSPLNPTISFLKIIAVLISALLFAVLFFRESFAGLVQLCDNQLLVAGESAFWSLLAAAGAYAVLTLVFAALLSLAITRGYFIPVIFMMMIDIIIILSHKDQSIPVPRS